MNGKDGSFISKDGCKYGIDCPLKPRGSVPYCCSNCAKRRESFVNDSNRHLWTDVGGFHSIVGCRLPREDMPRECRDYDCRRYSFIVIMEYINGKWQADKGMELEPDEIVPVKVAVNMTLKELHGKDNS